VTSKKSLKKQQRLRKITHVQYKKGGKYLVHLTNGSIQWVSLSGLKNVILSTAWSTSQKDGNIPTLHQWNGANIVRLC